MFDIDGTLLKSFDLDSYCYLEAINEITGLNISSDWDNYEHVTDSGILAEIIKKYKLENPNKLTQEVKNCFLNKLDKALKDNPLKEIDGAYDFLRKLKNMDNVVISIATGGWLESSVLKLNSARIDFSNIPLASSNIHYSRIEIMKAENTMATGNADNKFTYFGDRRWDKNACSELGVNFVLVGSSIQHSQQINNFLSSEKAMSYIGLQ